MPEYLAHPVRGHLCLIIDDLSSAPLFLIVVVWRDYEPRIQVVAWRLQSTVEITNTTTAPRGDMPRTPVASMATILVALTMLSWVSWKTTLSFHVQASPVVTLPCLPCCQVLWSWLDRGSASYRLARPMVTAGQDHTGGYPPWLEATRTQIHRFRLIWSRQSETRAPLAWGPAYGVRTAHTHTCRHSEFRPDHGAFYGERQSLAKTAGGLGHGKFLASLACTWSLRRRWQPLTRENHPARRAWTSVTRSQRGVGGRGNRVAVNLEGNCPSSHAT